MEAKYLNHAVIDNTIEGRVIRDVDVWVIEEAAGRFQRLTEERGEDSLVMRRVCFGCFEM